MSLPKNIEEISTNVRTALGSSTSLQFSDFRPLVGGAANYVFLGRLANPIPDDGIPTVIRDVAEAETLQAVGQCAEATNGLYCVRTPKLYLFSLEASTIVQEYLQDSINLKQYVLKYYEAHTPKDKQPQCFGIGDCLGRWLKNFHQFPELLSGKRQLFETLRTLAEEELKDDGSLQPRHGDYWSGNILIPDRAITDASSKIPMFVVDWEVVSLGMPVRDVGQMIAEMWMPKLFKGIDASEWLVSGFLAGYGSLDNDRAFRTAIHVGCHLAVIGGSVTGWGSPEDVTRVVSFGRDVIVKGHEKDMSWFRGGPWNQ
ncbi:kinase-like domain-containing protein [Schizothecium vesticola]|uniref:Kinase-like domain-containing protein n=1 Tax=Schizothecium vesticola TaxID=314040 RepID=A0AA40EQA8_9PEZI|nr:kinase-like domain-containing protein [Schizothecium vesticola]